MTPTPEALEAWQPGQWQVGVLASWSNYFDDDPRLSAIDAETVRFAMSVGYGLGGRLDHSNRTSWLLQALVTSPGAKDFGGFSKRSYEITAGFKRLLRPDLLLEVSLLENLFIFDNSPDVGFHTGLVWRSSAPARK